MRLSLTPLESRPYGDLLMRQRMKSANRQGDATGDAALLSSCLAGDEDAWRTLVERYSRLAWSIALKSGLSEDDAADAVQNVFTITLRRLESLRDTERFSAWLITTSHRECWRIARGNSSTPLDELPEPVDPEPASDEIVIAWEHASLVREAMGQLDIRCLVLLESLFLRDERPSYDAIAADLGIAIGSIGPTRARCLQRLKTELEGLGVVDARS
jgi:RNA polymerase sigma factor (sigma-70 family)